MTEPRLIVKKVIVEGQSVLRTGLPPIEFGGSIQYMKAANGILNNISESVSLTYQTGGMQFGFPYSNEKNKLIINTPGAIENPSIFQTTLTYRDQNQTFTIQAARPIMKEGTGSYLTPIKEATFILDEGLKDKLQVRPYLSSVTSFTLMIHFEGFKGGEEITIHRINEAPIKWNTDQPCPLKAPQYGRQTLTFKLPKDLQTFSSTVLPTEAMGSDNQADLEITEGFPNPPTLSEPV